MHLVQTPRMKSGLPTQWRREPPQSPVSQAWVARPTVIRSAMIVHRHDWRDLCIGLEPRPWILRLVQTDVMPEQMVLIRRGQPSRCERYRTLPGHAFISSGQSSSSSHSKKQACLTLICPSRMLSKPETSMRSAHASHLKPCFTHPSATGRSRAVKL